MNGFERLLILADFKPNTNQFFFGKNLKNEPTFSFDSCSWRRVLIGEVTSHHQDQTGPRCEQDEKKRKRKRGHLSIYEAPFRKKDKKKKKEKDSL